jgi:hypothetical protein
MIVEQRIYTLQVGALGEFVRYYEANGLSVQTRILGNLIGYFVTEVGPLNQIVHLWGYADFADRTRRRAALSADPAWLDYLKNQPPVIVAQENRILSPTAFSPIR